MHLIYILAITLIFNLASAVEESSPFSIEVDPGEPFLNVIERLRIANGAPCRIDFVVSGQTILADVAPSSNNSVRNYYAAVKGKEKDDMTYILRSLSNYSLIRIAANRSSIEKAGDRLDHIHPLRFLITVFTDEELKVYIRNMYDRSLVWKEFMHWVNDTFSREADSNNLSFEYLQDISLHTKVDPNILLPYVQKRQWSDLIGAMITNVPRANTPNRYNM